jgi:hypothetical protein
MHSAVKTAADVLAAASALVAAYGTFRWYRGEPSRLFWQALRTVQALCVLFAAYVGVLAASGRHPTDNLFYLYALLPLAVSFVAEQLRIASAQAELDRRGLADAQAVGRLPPPEQRAIVRAILRRELGVMTLACWVIVFLALRAAGTSGGFA